MIPPTPEEQESSSTNTGTMAEEQEVATVPKRMRYNPRRMISMRRIPEKKDHVVVGSTAANRKTTNFKKDKCKDKCVSRTLALRITAVMSLILAAVLCATISYKLIHNLEVEVGYQTNESVAVLALENAQSNIKRKLQGDESMATIMSFTFPNASQWPFVTLAGYTEINKKIADMSLSTEHSLSIIVQPYQREAFQNFSQEMYLNEGFPNYTGTSNFGFGIWKKEDVEANENTTYQDGRVPDITGETSWGSEKDILVPIMHVAHKHSKFLPYNLHSSGKYGKALDDILKCAADAKAANPEARFPGCGMITDFVTLLHRDKPAGVVRLPVYPLNDPTTVVGFISVTVFWEDILTNIVPDYVDGLTAVISTETQTYTYEIQAGVPVLLDEEGGDHHDPKYEKFAHATTLGHFETGTTPSATYHLTVYPTERVILEFQSSSPLAVSLGFVGVIAVCTAIFLLYDLLMRQLVYHHGVVLEMKRRFIRFISHEIRTPLNTVCTGLELLHGELDGQQSLDEKAVKVCSEVTSDVHENALAAVEVLNDILNYDKIESGTLKLEIEAVNIWKLLERSVNGFQVQAANRKVNLDLKVKLEESSGFKEDIEATASSALPLKASKLTVVGDHVRLGQVIRNIISNALKFTPPDGDIEVTASHLPRGLPKVDPVIVDNDPHPLATGHRRCGAIQIHVKDSGVGMTRDQLKMLFSEGVQFDANKLQHGGGSGLGLSIAKGIVEQHGGTIIAESDGYGHGTEFTVELPLYEISSEELVAMTTFNARDSASDHSPDPSATDSQPKTQGAIQEMQPPPTRHVLVVEDALMNIKMLVRLLERSGHTCATAINGELAIEAIAEDATATSLDEGHVPFDTILMDFEMPVLNGPEATEEIRKLGYKGTIFGVTGNMLEEDVEYFVSKGADKVLGKPISMKTLAQTWEHFPAKDRGKIYAS